MSVNKYDHTSGELTTLANGSRCWIGTKAAYDAEKQAGTLPSNCLIAITDDSEDNNYSTEERLTGKFWIDGKPIYRKVFTYASIPSNTTIDISDLNVDMLIVVSGRGEDNNSSNYVTLPYYDGGFFWSVFFHRANGANELTSKSQRTVTDANIVIEYTKTTD